MDFTGSGSRVFANLLSQVWGRLFSNIGARLLRVPLLLGMLGPDEYGRWLVLSSLSAWLAIPNTGAAGVAAGSMAMSTGGGEPLAARRTYSDLVVLKTVLCVVLAVGAWAASSVVPFQGWLGVSPERGTETVAALRMLSLGVLVAAFSEAFGARLKAAGRSHVPALWQGALQWSELLVLFAVLRHTQRFDHMAAALLAVTACFTIAMYASSRRVLPVVRFDRTCVTVGGLRRLLTKSLYYQAFPLGNALLLQGQVLVVQWLLGPAAVAVYSTARTLVRVISQGLETVNHSVWPEMSLMFGSRDMRRIAVLHRASVMLSLGLSVLSASLLLLFGPGLFEAVSGGMLGADRILLSCFLASVPLNALWYTSSMVQLACNRHEGVAARYLFSTMASLAAGIVMTRSMGLPGAALAACVSDLVMIPYVLRRSIVMTGDVPVGIWSRAWKDVTNLTGRPTP